MKNLVFVIAAVALAGCETTGENSSRIGGSIVGGLAGAAACAVSNANTTECALLIAGGAAAGYAIASYIDQDDAEAYQAASQSVLEGDETSVTRVSEATGTPVTVAASSTNEPFTNDEGQPCTYNDVTYKDGTHQDLWCKVDGKWTLQTA